MLNSLLQMTDPNLVANVLSSHITQAINIVAPLKTIQPRHKYAPHLSLHSKDLMTNRNQLKDIYNNSRLLADEIAYKKARNLAVKSQRSDRKKWAVKIINKTEKSGNDGKAMWKAAKSISGEAKKESIKKLILDGTVTSEKTKMANGLNVFFVEKVKNLVANMPTQHINLLETLKNTPTPQGQKMDLMELEMSQLDFYITNMKRNASAGSDDISGIILYDIYQSIKRVLLHLINLSMCLGIFPKIFKLTKITPILKPGKNSLEPSSYRPVANLCSMAKLLECSVMDQVRNHLNKNNFYNKNQHGSRASHSTTTCVTELLEDNNEAMEKGYLTAITAIDMSAAFDLVDHPTLIQKCRLALVGQPTLNWITSFLHDRTQMVNVNGANSLIIPTGNKGVVQGGKSSCELFTVFLNDLPAQVNGGIEATTPLHSTSKEYIDDISTVSRGRTLEELKSNIEDDLGRISQYLENHMMIINKQKTQLMFIKQKNQSEQLTVNFNGAKIPHQKEMKILGITLADDLTYDKHLWSAKSNITKSIRYKASIIKAIKPFLPLKSLSTVGNSLINSTIIYGAPVWGNTTKKNIDLVQKAQMQAARVILGANWGKDKMTHRQTLLDRLGWPNVGQMILSASTNLVRKAGYNSSSQGLNNKIKKTIPKSLRNTKSLRLNHLGPAIRKDTQFSAKATQEFNKLPITMRDSTLTERQFKRLMKTHSRKVKLLPQH